jgi:FixJ family two-component response regulator
MTTSKPVVFIVDDDQAVLDSVAFLLGTVGLSSRTCASAQEFLDAYHPDTPGCVVLDMRMPGMGGLQLQEHLQEAGSTLPVIFLTAHGDVPAAVRAVKAGAVDFIQKPFREQEFLDTVQRAIDENARLRRDAAQRREIAGRIARLTPREREVMERIVEGKANKVIADELGVSQRTVEVHRAHVMEKFGVESLAELVQMVVRVREDRGRTIA